MTIDGHLPLRKVRGSGAADMLYLLDHAQCVYAYGRFLYGPGGARRHEAPVFVERAAA